MKLACLLVATLLFAACAEDCPTTPAPVHEAIVVSWAVWRDCDSLYTKLQVQTSEPWIFCEDTYAIIERRAGSRDVLPFRIFARETSPRWYVFEAAAALCDVGDVVRVKAVGGRAGGPTCEPRIDRKATVAGECDQ